MESFCFASGSNVEPPRMCDVAVQVSLFSFCDILFV